MPSKRIHNIIEYMTYEIYLYVQRGLFERHKIIFALMLTNKVSMLQGPRFLHGAPTLQALAKPLLASAMYFAAPGLAYRACLRR